MTNKNTTPVNNNEMTNGIAGRQEMLHSGYRILKVKLDDYGFEEAGVNKGNAKALENFLNEITEGHLIDETQSEQDTCTRHKLIEDAMEEKKREMISLKSNAEHLEKHVIPDKEEDIREKQDDIKKLEIEKIDGKVNPDHDPLMIWVLGSLSVLVGIYLVLFYASAIHSAFFRDLIQDMMKSGTSQNLSMRLNSIFDPSALITRSSSILIIYFGSTMFFAIGLLAHHFLHKPNRPWKKVFVWMLSIALPLISDGLLAAKIQQNIKEVKGLMGIVEKAAWFESMNFWLVIVFGYVAYMVWGLIFHLFRKERAGRNPVHSANFAIQNLKREIKVIREEIRQHRIEVNTINTTLEGYRQELEHMKKQLTQSLQDPDLLLHRLYQFYSGWLRYLNAGNMDGIRSECTRLFESYISKNFHDSCIPDELLTHNN
jgi:hypothetical protein